jgi:hypothetical protein
LESRAKVTIILLPYFVSLNLINRTWFSIEYHGIS